MRSDFFDKGLGEGERIQLVLGNSVRATEGYKRRAARVMEPSEDYRGI